MSDENKNKEADSVEETPELDKEKKPRIKLMHYTKGLHNSIFQFLEMTAQKLEELESRIEQLENKGE